MKNTLRTKPCNLPVNESFLGDYFIFSMAHLLVLQDLVLSHNYKIVLLPFFMSFSFPLYFRRRPPPIPLSLDYLKLEKYI